MYSNEDKYQTNVNYEQFAEHGLNFFVPYEDGSDVMDTLAKPFYAPFLMAAFTVIAAVVAAIAFVVCLISLILAMAAGIVGADDFRESALDVAGQSIFISLIATVLTPILAVGIVIAPVASLIAIFTRTCVSIVSVIANGESIDENDEPSESLGDDEDEDDPRFAFT